MCSLLAGLSEVEAVRKRNLVHSWRVWTHPVVLFRRTTSVCKVRITCITEAVVGHDADSAVELVRGGFSVSDAL